MRKQLDTRKNILKKVFVAFFGMVTLVSVLGCESMAYHILYCIVDGEENLRKGVERNYRKFLRKNVSDEEIQDRAIAILLEREVTLAKAQINYSSMRDGSSISEKNIKKLREINEKSYYKTLNQLEEVLSKDVWEKLVPKIKKTNYHGPPRDDLHEFELR